MLRVQWMLIRKPLGWAYLQRMPSSGWISKHGTDVGSGEMYAKAMRDLMKDAGMKSVSLERVE